MTWPGPAVGAPDGQGNDADGVLPGIGVVTGIGAEVGAGVAGAVVAAVGVAAGASGVEIGLGVAVAAAGGDVAGGRDALGVVAQPARTATSAPAEMIAGSPRTHARISLAQRAPAPASYAAHSRRQSGHSPSRSRRCSVIWYPCCRAA